MNQHLGKRLGSIYESKDTQGMRVPRNMGGNVKISSLPECHRLDESSVHHRGTYCGMSVHLKTKQDKRK